MPTPYLIYNSSLRILSPMFIPGNTSLERYSSEYA